LNKVFTMNLDLEIIFPYMDISAKPKK